MPTSFARRLTIAVAAIRLLTPSSPALAQEAPTSILSINIAAPAMGRLGGEVETCGSHRRNDCGHQHGCVGTVGVAVTTGHVDVRETHDDAAYRARFVDTDLIFRLRLSDEAFRGWAFGVKVGFTSVEGLDTYLGSGIEASQTWRPMEHLVITPTMGVKGVVGMSDRVSLDIIPTVRLNVGVAF